MKRLIPLFLLMLGLAGCASSPSDSRPHDDAVTAVIRRQQAAWNRGDIDAFMVGYLPTEDLIFTSGARIRRGYAKTLEGYKRGYTPETMGRLEFSNLEVRSLGENAAWVLGRWDLFGLEQPAGGIFTLIFRRVDGEWLIVHDHTSSDPKKDA